LKFKENSQPLPKNAKIFLDSLVIPFGYDKLGIINLSSLPAVSALNASVEALNKKIKNGGGIESFLNIENLEEENGQKLQQPYLSCYNRSNVTRFFLF
jgi:hypothetical protein